MMKAGLPSGPWGPTSPIKDPLIIAPMVSRSSAISFPRSISSMSKARRRAATRSTGSDSSESYRSILGSMNAIKVMPAILADRLNANAFQSLLADKPTVRMPMAAAPKKGSSKRGSRKPNMNRCWRQTRRSLSRKSDRKPFAPCRITEPSDARVVHGRLGSCHVNDSST